MKDTAAQSNKIQGLADFVSAQAVNKPLPVDTWHPPYCGDIGIAIKADGTWLYQGSPIQRKPLIKLFSRILRRDPNGRHYLVTPAEKVDVDVADAPFLAVEMQVVGHGSHQQLIFRTNVDDIVYCGPDNPLRFDEEQERGGLKPYVSVRGRLDALVSRSLCYDLVDLARPQKSGENTLAIWSGGAFFPLPPA